MALLKAQEVRNMSADDRQKRLTELRGQLMNERGIAAMGGSPPSPGKIRQLRTAIARILTIQNQDRAGKIQWAKGETPKASTPKPAAPKKPSAKPKAGPATAPKKAASHAKSDAKKPTAAKKAAPAKKTTKKEE